MRRYISAALGAATVSFALISASVAADMPLKSPAAALSQSGGVYLWTDDSYQSIKLPTYDLGFRVQGAGTTASSPGNSFDPRATGYGLSGGIGFILPPGMFLSNIGSNARVEIGGSYAKATAAQNGATVFGLGGAADLPQLNGVNSIATGCGGASSCATTASLSTDYSAWQISGRFATDFKTGFGVLTPSIAMFGGRSRNEQTLSQRLTFPPSTASFAQYDAATQLTSNDWGARIGLDAAIPVAERFTLGLGGKLGLAARRVSLSGSDTAFVNAGGFILPLAPGAVSTGANTTAVTANAETSLAYRVTPAGTIRVFTGLDFDQKVAGITAAAVPPGTFGAGGTTGPATIKFQSTTSWYGGGGFVVKF